MNNVATQIERVLETGDRPYEDEQFLTEQIMFIYSSFNTSPWLDQAQAAAVQVAQALDHLNVCETAEHMDEVIEMAKAGTARILWFQQKAQGRL